MNNLTGSANIIRTKRIRANSVSIPQAKRIYFPELDGLRFLAFLIVFIVHHSIFSKTSYYSKIFDNAWVVVDLFFVLTAFLFTKLLIAEYKKTKTISFKKFYIRHIFRIWPIYFLIISLSFLALIFKHQAITNDIWIRLIGLVTFSDNIIASTHGLNTLPFTLHLWAIGYEEQFCLLIPIVTLLLIRSSLKLRLICFLLVIFLFNIIRIVFIVNKAPYPSIYVLPVTHFESILLGIVMGFGGADFILKKTKPLILQLTCILFFILLLLLPNNEASISYWHIASYSCAGITAALLLHTVLNNNYLKQALSKKILVYLGKRSYGLFVYHLLGISLANFMVTHITAIPSTPLTSLLYSLTFTIIIALVSCEIIEKPFLNLKKKFQVIATRPV